MSFPALAEALLKHLTFHTYASCQAQQSALVNDGNYINYLYKPSYDVDSSSGVIKVVHYPFPSSGTYLHHNDLNDHSSGTIQHYLKPVYKHDHTQVAILNRQYNVL